MAAPRPRTERPRLVSINGSPHGEKGGTARIEGWLTDACAEEGVEVRRVFLADLDLEQCDGCGACMSAGECPLEDGVGEVHDTMVDADLVVFSSPTYVFSITGRMKTFIDRTAALFHRPPLLEAYGAVVTSSAGLGESKVIAYLAETLGLLGAGYVGAVWGTYRPPGRLWEPESVRNRAERLGRDFAAAARERRDLPPTDEVVGKRRFLKELIEQNRKIFKADHAWWTDRGWYDDLPGTRRPKRG